MYRNYISRYINIDKCDVVNKFEKCKTCGAELIFAHFLDASGQMVEAVECPKCRKKSANRYALH